MVYEQNRVNSKDTLIKTSVCVRIALLKRVIFKSKEGAYISNLILVGIIRVFVKHFAVCSLFSALNYLNSSTYIRTYINHKNRHECTNLESLLRYNVDKIIITLINVHFMS